jgi:hypothetical protein
MQYSILIVVAAILAALCSSAARPAAATNQPKYRNRQAVVSDSSPRRFHLKWVYDAYPLPIFLEKPIRLDADYKWFKYTENKYIDELNDHASEYLYSQTRDKTKMYILAYDARSHKQLSSYEPKPIAVRLGPDATDNNVETKITDVRDIYTLAFLKTHEISVDTQTRADRVELSCSALVYLPLNENDYYNQENYKLIQKSVSMNMRMTSDDEPGQIWLDEGAAAHSKHNKHKHREHLPPGRRRRRSVLHMEIENKSKGGKLKSGQPSPLPLSAPEHGYIEITLREGPIVINKLTRDDQFRSENVTCSLSLLDFDNSINYENTVYKIVDNRGGSGGGGGGGSSTRRTLKSSAARALSTPSSTCIISMLLLLTLNFLLFSIISL